MTFVACKNMYCFVGCGRQVTVYDDVVDVWYKHRQIMEDSVESFGVLIGTTSVDRRKIWIKEVTTPMVHDQCSQFSFALRDPGHQQMVCEKYACSDGREIYLGTWHTHPEPMPTPSDIDQNDWIVCLQANHGRPLAFVLVGTENVRMFVRTKGRFKSLRQKYGSKNVD